MNSQVEQTVMTNQLVGAKYDKCCKEFFNFKETIAPILKYVVPEFQGMTNEEIIQCMDDVNGDIPVSDVSIKITNENTEQSSVLEKTIFYDSHFKVKNPKLSNESILIYLYINFEVQNNYKPSNPSYHVEKRMVYYLAREISSQLGILTEQTNYDDIQKVYSIWVCNENVPKHLQNTISRYKFQREDVVKACGEEAYEDDSQYFDLMEGIIIRRGKDAPEEGIFNYLDGVFESDIEKIRKYVDMDSNPEIEKEVVNMSGMGQTIYNNGVKYGEKCGENHLAELITKLLAAGRNSDVALAAKDEEARKKLYREFGIIE